MSKVTFDYSKAAQFVSGHEVEYMKKLTLDAKEVLLNKSGAGNDFLGWVDLPVDYDKEEFARIKEAAKKFKVTAKYCWLLALVDRIWVQEQRLNFCVIAFIIWWTRVFARHLKSTLLAIPLVPHILSI